MLEGFIVGIVETYMYMIGITSLFQLGFYIGAVIMYLAVIFGFIGLVALSIKIDDMIDKSSELMM